MTSTCSGSSFPSTDLLEKHCCLAVPTSGSVNIIKCENEESPLVCSPTQEHTKDQGTETFSKLSKILKTEPVSELTKVSSNANASDGMEKVPEESIHKIQTESTYNSDADSVHRHEHQNEGQPMSACNSTPVEVQDQSFVNDYVKSEHLSRALSDCDKSLNRSEKSANTSKTLLKVLASAYMSCRQPAQLNSAQNKRALLPRKVSPRAPVSAPMTVPTLCTSINQLSEEASDCSTSTFSDGKITSKPSNIVPKKNLISMTKLLSPVVALETHQKLISENIEGRHQCGLCRRVFQDKDSLIMHHALHRKERVKFCRHCHEFVLGASSSQFYHDCFSSSRAGTFKSFFTTLHLNSKKVFQCLLCNRTYTRRHRLKVHKCLAPGDTVRKTNKVLAKQLSTCHTRVRLNTDKYKTKPVLYGRAFQSGLPKSFPPFKSNLSKITSDQSMKIVKIVEEETKGDLMSETSDLMKTGQWTVPLDDAEVDVISDEECSNTLDVCKEKLDEVIIVESALKRETKSVISNEDIQVQISDFGVRRFSCNRCQRSYARRFTLIQHLKICRTGKYLEPKLSTNIQATEKMFSCPQCGSSFTRKDNMKMHLKRCQFVRPYSMDRNIIEQNQAGHDNIFVLPPDSQNQFRQDGSNNGGAASGSWGIMSLPTVLPRKVTCECGAAFTCPRLLFEHLQKHAQESYICSQCGEDLQSWADLEAHRKLHVQASRQNIQDKNSSQQQSQPLILPVQGFQSLEPNPKKPLALDAHVHLNKCRPAFKPLRCPVCVRWFSSLEGLKRHLLSHSQQEDPICQICGYKCSSHLALEDHKKSVHGINRVSESSTVQSATISQSSSSKPFCCQICQRSYPKLQSLKDHVRKVHRPKTLKSVNVGNTESKPDIQFTENMQESQSNAAVQLLTESMHLSRSKTVFQSSTQPAKQRRPQHLKCQICSCTFADIQSLNNHKRTVHILGGVPPLKEALQPSHSNPFQCQVCGRSYPDISSLRNHRRRVHRIIGGLGINVELYKGLANQIQDRPFKCQICLRSYPHLASLKKHRRRVHRISSNALDPAKVATTPMKHASSVPFYQTTK